MSDTHEHNKRNSKIESMMSYTHEHKKRNNKNFELKINLEPYKSIHKRIKKM